MSLLLVLTAVVIGATLRCEALSVQLTSPSSDTFLAFPANLTVSATATNTSADPVYTITLLTNGVPLIVVTNTTAQLVFTGAYTWTNIGPGAYDVTATATTVGGRTDSTDPVLVYAYLNGTAPTVSVANAGTRGDLTTIGTNDWAHWGYYWGTTFDHKLGVASQIGNYRVLNYGIIYCFRIPGGRYYTWSDGTPVPSTDSIDQAAFTYDNKFEVKVAASTNSTTRTAKFYLGAYDGATGKITIFLSDGSAPPQTVSVSCPGAEGSSTNFVCTVTFRSNQTNSFLCVRYGIQVANYIGFIGLHAAVLSTGNWPPQTTLTNPVTGSTFSYPTNIALDATASDPDGSVSKVEFFDGSSKLGEIVSAPYHFVWTNAPPGLHRLTARVTDNAGATFTSLAINASVIAGGGYLAGSFDPLPPSVDLTAEGRTDWIHFGLTNATDVDHRNLVIQRINKAPGAGLNQLSDFPISFNWTDGTPNASANTTSGIFVYGLNNGFQITAPVDTLQRRLKLYLSAYAELGELQASLSDGSALAFLDYSVSNVFDSTYGVYTLDYAAATSNTTLSVQFTSSAAYDSQYGNVTLEAATLSMLDGDLRNVTKSGNAVRLDFPSDDLQSYQLEYTDALAPTNWVPLTSFLGNGALTNISDTTATGAQRFYRVTGP